MPIQSALVAASVATPYGFILNLLSSLLREELGLLSGFKDELEKLESIFTRIQSVLEDAMTRQLQDRALQDWLEKLTYMAYHTEDVLEEFNFEVLRRKTASRDGRCREVRDFFSGNNQLKFRFLMAHKIKDLREKMDSFSKEVSQFKLEPGALQRPLENMNDRVTHSFVESTDVIGREEERKRIVAMLLSAAATSEGFSVIAIVGVGGVGKTTLAQLVYTDSTSELDRYFNLKIWICVSDNFDVSRLLKSIIELTTGKKCEVNELDLLQNKVRGLLRRKRFFLVLDDVWNEEQKKWDDLKVLLRSCLRGSKIVITTRSLKVSSVMGSSENLQLQLSRLSDDISWKLFQSRAFEDGATPIESIVAIGKEIVKKCAGIPLAALALGSLLRFKSEEVYWRKILESEIWESFNSEPNELMPALRLSYDHLSPQAKQCFAFCSLFPKAYEMEREVLIWQWTCNGFVLNEQNGHAIFNDLLWRSFFLEATKDEDGRIRKCKLHDLMHDLARWVAGKHLCTVTKEISGDTVNEKTYHLLIDERLSKSGMIKKTKKAKSLRTLLISRCNPIEKSFLSRIFVMLRFLRVLDLSRSEIKVIPYSVGCLIHLRYLDLSSNSIESLPESIGYILNLQVLKLPKTKIKKLPESLTKLQSLRYLDIRGCIFLTDMPVGVKKLTHLQTLTDFTIGVEKTSCGLGELKELNLTGELFIWHIENFKTEDTEIEQTILSNKEDLVSLRLKWHHRGNSASNSERVLDLLRPHKNLKRLQLHSYTGLKFPTWLSDSLLTSLVEIKLTYCAECKRLPSFGGIASLKDLQIIGMHEVRQISGEFYGTGRVKGFPSLENLAFYDMPKLAEWSILEVMPFSQLNMLTIGRCSALRSIPWVQSLQKLDLSHCSSSLLGSLPNTSNLPVLSSLLMDNIQGLTFLPNGFLLCFSSLRKLIVCSCMQLEKLPLIDMQQLVTLQSLEISDCPELESLAFNAVQLTCLRNLNIRNCIKLESLPQNWTGITSLQSISIADCRNVTSWTETDIEGLSSVSDFSLEICNDKINVSGWLQHLTNLQTLTIHGGHDNRHPQPRKLITGNSLSICCCGNGLDALLQGLSNASSLEHLRLEYISGIALPDSIGEIQSLKDLSIYDSPAVASLPESEKAYRVGGVMDSRLSRAGEEVSEEYRRRLEHYITCQNS